MSHVLHLSRRLRYLYLTSHSTLFSSGSHLLLFLGFGELKDAFHAWHDFLLHVWFFGSTEIGLGLLMRHGLAKLWCLGCCSNAFVIWSMVTCFAAHSLSFIVLGTPGPWPVDFIEGMDDILLVRMESVLDTELIIFLFYLVNVCLQFSLDVHYYSII